MDKIETYKAFFDTSPDGVIIATSEGKIFLANREAERMFGYEKGEMIGQDTEILNPERYHKKYILQRADYTGNPKVIEAGERKGIWACRKDKSEFAAEVRYSPIQLGDKMFTVATIKDVTERNRAAAILRENEERYRILVENAPEALVVIDLENRKFISVSESATELFKMSKEELLRSGVLDISPAYQPNGQLSAQAAMEKIMEAVEGGKPVFEWTHSDKFGNLIPCEVRLVRLPAENKILIRGSVSDISERKKAAEELKKNTDRYRGLLNKLEAAVVVHAADTSFISCNPKAEELLGLSEEQMKGKLDIDKEWRFLREDKSELPISEYPVNQIISGKKNIKELVLGINRPACNDVVWAVVNGYPVTNSQNEIEEIVISFIDITERKRAEEEIKTSEEKYRTLVEHASDAIFIADSDGRFLTVNSSLSRISHYTREELLNMTIYDFALADDLQKNPFHFDELNQGKTVVTERLMKGKNGFLLHVEINAKRLIDGRLLIFVKDISQRKKDEQTIIDAKEKAEASEKDLLKKNQEYEAINEKLKQTNYELTEAAKDIKERKITEAELKRKSAELIRANEELEQFAYVASHDLQEPLRTISNFVGLLNKRYSGKEEDTQYIQFILAATTRMQNLIKALLDFSRIGNKITYETVDCQVILENVKSELELTIKENNAHITSSVLPVLTGNEIILKQLFQNLISNAIKFRKKDVAPQINISFQEKENEFLFAFSDNGIGIDKKYSDKIFIIFQRLHSDAEYQGTGIGLATCSKIVSHHHGKLWVESELGKGSTFYFTISKR